jgi:hypothetical protein
LTYYQVYANIKIVEQNKNLPEQLPNQTNTTSSYAPAPQDPLEVTPQDVYQASPDDITDAMDGLAEKYRRQMLGASGPAEQKMFRSRMIAAESTSESIIYWQRSNKARSEAGQPEEPFKDFLDRASGENDALEKIIIASSFVYDSAYENSVADVIHRKRA